LFLHHADNELEAINALNFVAFQ
jgi:hypothetical protein